MEILENLTLKTADLLCVRRKMPNAERIANWFVSLPKKILPFLFFKNLLNDCEITELENNKKSVLSISLLGSNNDSEADNSRISCGYSQKTVRSFKWRGLINLTYIHRAIYIQGAISIHGANSKDYAKVNSNKVNMKRKNFSKKKNYVPSSCCFNAACCVFKHRHRHWQPRRKPNHSKLKQHCPQFKFR